MTAAGGHDRSRERTQALRQQSPGTEHFELIGPALLEDREVEAAGEDSLLSGQQHDVIFGFRATQCLVQRAKHLRRQHVRLAIVQRDAADPTAAFVPHEVHRLLRGCLTGMRCSMLMTANV